MEDFSATMNKVNIKYHFKIINLRGLRVLILMFILVAATSVFAQEPSVKSTVYLKNGTVFNGEILMKSDDVMVMKTDDGIRYQFQMSEIDRVEHGQKRVEKPKSEAKQSNFSGILEINGAFAKAAIEGLEFSPQFSANLALGTRDMLKTKTFVGIGTGFELIPLKYNNKELAFIPIFVQISKTLNNKPISPFIGLKSGYSFNLNKEYKGGVLLQLTSGVNVKLNNYKSLNVGIFGKIQEVSGTITENNEYGSFTKQGSTKIINVGISAGFAF